MKNTLYLYALTEVNYHFVLPNGMTVTLGIFETKDGYTSRRSLLGNDWIIGQSYMVPNTAKLPGIAINTIDHTHVRSHHESTIG